MSFGKKSSGRNGRRPKDQTEVADFFKYLKGNDGKDGKDGKSAFDQWKDMIANGSVDNHWPRQQMASGNNTCRISGISLRRYRRERPDTAYRR